MSVEATTEILAQTGAGWLPDLVLSHGAFISGAHLLVDAEGRIRQVSNQDGVKTTRIRSRAILPGLVNVHSHTFQRAIRGRTEYRSQADRDTFWTWREKMYRAATLLSPEDIYAVARMAFLEMAVSGITTVGEFHYLHHQPDGKPYSDRLLLGKAVVRAAREIGLRIVLLRTAYARAGFAKPPNPGQARFITPDVEEFLADTDEMIRWCEHDEPASLATVAVAPHSVRAVPLSYLRQVSEYGGKRELPVHIHVSEQPAENEECRAEYGTTPIDLLSKEGLVDNRFTAIHAIHITGAEARALGTHGAFVCACPTSERNLGDGAVPAGELLAAGGRLSLGSDSQIQIDLLEDARLLEYHLRMEQLERVVLTGKSSGSEQLAKVLFQSATRSGAESLGFDGGNLAVGQPADFFTVDLDDPSLAGADQGSLLSHLVFSLERSAVRDVFVNGRQIVTNGRHPLQEEITEGFKRVQKRLWGRETGSKALLA